MRIAMYTGRPRTLFWGEGLCAKVARRPQIASSHEQAERMFTAVKTQLNGRDPKGIVPG